MTYASRALRALASAALETDTRGIEAAADVLAAVLQRGGTIYACGNGGSAAEATHFIGELVGRMGHDRRPLRGVALLEPATLTALANDYGYEQVFARQAQALCTSHDALVCYTTSGNSQNVRRAVLAAKTSVVIMGAHNASVPGATVTVRVASDDGQRIQELHAVVTHALVAEIEERIGA